jgi:uncharacterized phage protein (TIGR01671 family)
VIPKFRIWDKHAKRMSYGTPELYDDMIGFRFEHFSVETDSFDDLVLMQSTGLKDKNGVEIYEGDIVEGQAIKSNGGFEYKGKVEFVCQSNVHGYCITDISGGSWDIEQLGARISLDHTTGIIIGNIYQHPELLEE